jgi:FimV-like protein
VPPAQEETDVPDARTTVAIDVETLAPQPAQATPANTGRRTYQVHSGESLWNIARQFRPAGAGENLYQVLLSIHNLNRSSFINGNISLLKANAMLQVPTATDIERIDATTAQVDFERRWDQGTQRVDAAQRGEAIPLFTDDAAADEDVVEVEASLPPGVEAPVISDDEDALIMVSETNVPQPLQMATGSEAEAASTDAPSVASSATISTQAIPSSAESIVPAPVVTTQTLSIATTRAVVTTELETELAAMRARRQSAEAVAQQLQASLEKARAERAAQASPLGMENLLLGAGTVVLFGLLMAGLVASLRLAGDLRSLRAGTSVALRPQTDDEWLAGRTRSRPDAAERKEPLMPAMEVVELPLSALKATAAEVPRASTAKGDGDLFARMDDLIGADSGNSPKNS